MSDGPYDIAYLVNAYPKVSHTFIRREILELERKGFRILRISVRGWDAPLADPQDISEREKTVFILKAGMLRVAGAVLREILLHPARFRSAASVAFGLMRGSDQPALWHLFYLAEACWTAGLIRRYRIPHIHAHFGTNPAEVAALTAAVAGVTFSFTMHGSDEVDRIYGLQIAKKVGLSAFTVAISSYTAGQIYRVADVADWSKVKVVYCGVDASFSEGATGAPQPAKKTLVCVGRLCGAKGQILLVEAMADLVKAGRAVELRLVGDGEHRPYIESQIERHGLQRYIHITGWVGSDRVKQEMLAAHAVVLPSFMEGLPIVLIEAMMLGRPVVTTYVAGIPELVLAGQTGWLFPPGDKQGLMAAICDCLDAQPDVIEGMARLGRQRALEHHSLSVQADKLAALFAPYCRQGAESGHHPH